MTRNHPSTRDASSPAHMNELLEARLSRRDTLRGGFGLAATTILAGAGLSACNGDDNGDSGSDTANNGDGNGAQQRSLSFNSVALTDADTVVVPEGYTAKALVPWGTPILPGAAAFDPASNTAADQAGQMGQQHDGLKFFPFPQGSDSSDSGLLVMNHEYLNSGKLFPNGRQEEEITIDGETVSVPTDIDQVRTEMAALGVSVVQIERGANGDWVIVQNGFNRRITVSTEIDISGPAAGSNLLITPYSPSGNRTRGTLNDCGRGFTPWGTYLACEENFQTFFSARGETLPREKARYGLTATPSFCPYWSHVASDANDTGEFARFNVTPTGAGPTDDWRNEANNFGWLVEIDPFDPNATPVKRTAMGRMRHEGAEPGLVTPGKQIAFYMGDDQNFQYFYKFVTADAYDPNAPDPDMLDRGTLYVAKFAADGSGQWLAVDISNTVLEGDFADQADVLVNTRSAADVLGATPMDRPEWSTTDPNTGEIYLTLTNCDPREEANAVNPRTPNVYGHIIRLAEDGAEPAATSFTWDIFVFGAPADKPDINRSGLTTENEFGGPDGLWFDPRGVLWIQTDNGDPLSTGTDRDQMLAVIPATLTADGVDPVITPDNQASLKRFLSGPNGCEVTGIDMTPDNKTMFVNIQHPGGTWPNGGTSVARSATVAITRDDGGEIAL